MAVKNPFGRAGTRESIRRGNTARYAGQKYLIEGEYLNMEEIAARLGVDFGTAKRRHAALCKLPGNITWHALETIR